MPRPAPISTEQQHDISRRYQAGESQHSLARSFGIHRSFVARTLVRNGVRRRTMTEACPGFPLRHDAFADAKNDEQAAYWVGFLMADGCVHPHHTGASHVKLTLSAQDESHLMAFKDFMGAVDHKIQRHPAKQQVFEGQTINGGECVSLTLVSDQLATALARYGVLPRKSHTAKVSLLANNRHFWRGVVDGDGSLFFTRRKQGRIKPEPTLSVVGSFDLMTQFADYAQQHCNSKARPRKDHSSWQMSWVCRPAVELVRHLYSPCSIALIRKHNVAQEIMVFVIRPYTHR